MKVSQISSLLIIIGYECFVFNIFAFIKNEFICCGLLEYNVMGFNWSFGSYRLIMIMAFNNYICI